jgi:hypothetical protein
MYAHMDTGSTDKGIPSVIKHPPPKSTDDGRIKPRHRDPPTEPKHPPPKTTAFDGRVKPKDRDPPVTCRNGDKCIYSAEDCLFAHKDIRRNDNGLRKETTHLPSELTASVTDWIPSHVMSHERQKITCHHWLRGPEGCYNDDCTFAHRNTGWATPDPDPNTQPVRIDPTLKPRGVPPKHAKPPVTCPYWLRSEQSCTKSPAECKYAHWNTGWAPPAFTSRKALPINPNQQPVNFRIEKNTSKLPPTRPNDDAAPAQAEHRTAPSGPRSANDRLSWYRKTGKYPFPQIRGCSTCSGTMNGFQWLCQQFEALQKWLCNPLT